MFSQNLLEKFIQGIPHVNREFYCKSTRLRSYEAVQARIIANNNDIFGLGRH